MSATRIGLERSDYYYNPSTGDIATYKPLVGSVSPIPNGYVMLVRIVAVSSFTTADGLYIEANTKGGLVPCKLDNNFTLNKNLKPIEEFMDISVGGKTWLDYNSKLLESVKIENNVHVKSSTIKGTGKISGNILIKNSTITLTDNSNISVSLGALSNIVNTTINGSISFVDNVVNLTNAEIDTSNVNIGNTALSDVDGKSLVVKANLTLGTSTVTKTKLELKDKLLIYKDLSFTGNKIYKLSGYIKGNHNLNSNATYDCDIRLEPEGTLKVNSSTVNGNLNISGIVDIKANSTFNGIINSYSNSNLILNGVTCEATINNKGICNISSTNNKVNYSGTITINNSGNLTSSSTNSNPIEGSLIVNGTVRLNNNSKVKGICVVKNMTLNNNSNIDGNNTIDQTLTANNDVSIKGTNRFFTNITLYGNVSFKEDSNCTINTTNTLVVRDNVEFNNECLIKGTPSFLNNAKIYGCKLIEGSPIIKENATVNNIYCIDSNVTIKGNAVVGGNLYITGDTIIGGEMNINIDKEITGDPTVDKYDVEYFINYGRYEFDWNITAPYQMCLVITPFKEPLYFYRKSSKDTRIKLPKEQEVMSMAKLGHNINKLVMDLKEKEIEGASEEELGVIRSDIRELSQYHNLAYTYMNTFCKSEGFDPSVVEIEPLVFYKI